MVKNLLKAASGRDAKAVGLADLGHLFGAMEFCAACKSAKIQPLLGAEFALHEPDIRFCLFAKNDEGYLNLCKLVSNSTVGQPPELREKLTLRQVSKNCDGLLCFSKDILHDGIADRFCEIFRDRFYIEISRCENKDTNEAALIDIAYRKGLPLLATNEALFLEKDDHEANDILSCISKGEYIHDANREKVSPEKYFKTEEEMVDLFHDLPEVLENTVLFARRCSFFLDNKKCELPSYPCESENDEMVLQSKQGLEKRFAFMKDLTKEKEEEYKKHLEYECDMIIHMGFSGYFLIVSDFIKWAKEQEIPVGPGRGSGAGSLVAWCLFITDVDPLRFGLSFERFLNPERVSMPDFDVDFCQDRRDEVIEYVCKKYGRDRVAQIITFGTLQARAVLRDVGRVLQMPYSQVDSISKLVPQNPAHPINLEEALKIEPRLNEIAEADPQIAYLLKISRKLEGMYRHASIHAAGIVIGRRPLCECVPLYQESDAKLPATEFSLKFIEKAGLVKFDFLGLKTLTVLQNSVNLVRKRGINIDLLLISMDDKKTFDMLCRVETIGMFQIESTGMSNVLRKLQPGRFEEVIALIALYRPGPMDDIPRYLACRHGKEKVTYPYPCLEGILKETFGVMTYQEQVMQIARVLAGYTMGGADILRRAMGKKVHEEMDAQRKIFIEGALKNYGGKEEDVSQLFDQISKFASYAFPKAHATPYALIVYQTAYMKANYPVEFMTALMIQDISNSDKLLVFVSEAKRLGIEVLCPDINKSNAQFSVEEKTDGTFVIRYALAALKNVGISAMEHICKERSENGPYVDIYDFVERAVPVGLNKRAIESLILSGALDVLHPNRRQLLESVDTLLKHGTSAKESAASLFSVSSTRPELSRSRDFEHFEKLQNEFLAVGFFLSEHPLNGFCSGNKEIILCKDVFLHVSEHKGTPFSMAGIIMDSKEKVSKSSNKYAFMFMSDPSGTYDAVMFSDVLTASRSVIKNGKSVILRVTGQIEEENIRLTVQSVIDLGEYTSYCTDPLVIKVTNEDQLYGLKRYIDNLPEGEAKIFLQMDDKTIRLARKYRVTFQNKAEIEKIAALV